MKTNLEAERDFYTNKGDTDLHNSERAFGQDRYKHQFCFARNNATLISVHTLTAFRQFDAIILSAVVAVILVLCLYSKTDVITAIYKNRIINI